MSDEPRLRGGSGRQSGPWPIGQIPQAVIRAIGGQLVHRLAIGRDDISGDEFGDIFSEAIGGTHYRSPLGLGDVTVDKTVWSVKTVKDQNPHKKKKVRLISGRNSPDFSHGIENAHADFQKTGGAVLSIWNSRLNAVRTTHNDVRIVVLVRNMETRQFTLFEEEATRYAPEDYQWGESRQKNLEGRSRADGAHHFTWQFHGSQFTIIRHVPGSAVRFRINRDIPLIEQSAVLDAIDYHDDWIDIN